MKGMNCMPDYLTIKEASVKLKISKKSVEKMLKIGLPHIKLGEGNSSVRISDHSLDTWLARGNDKEMQRLFLFYEYQLKYKIHTDLYRLSSPKDSDVYFNYNMNNCDFKVDVVSRDPVKSNDIHVFIKPYTSRCNQTWFKQRNSNFLDDFTSSSANNTQLVLLIDLQNTKYDPKEYVESASIFKILSKTDIDDFDITENITKCLGLR